MVFHEIESIADVLSGHRIIIYYIHGKSKSHNKNDVDPTLFSNTELALEMLEKKNDDLLLVKIPHESESRKQFEELYRPEVTGIITLFTVNNEGIPILSKQIHEVMHISSAIEEISTACKLSKIHTKDLNKLNSRSEKTSEHSKSISEDTKEFARFCSVESCEGKGLPKTYSGIKSAELLNLSTRLQIRLPSGTREEERFDSDATLQEVWITISTKFNIRDFDLKTYNHPIFSESDYERTLQELDLCPSGVIIVVNKNVASFNNGGRVRAFIEGGVRGLITTTISAFTYIQALVFVFWNYIFPASNGPASRGHGSTEIKSSNDKSHHSSSKSGAKMTRSKNIGNNIHTLRRNEDSDDENNRYNGNSTQQK